jgi:antibiotic biosynthesis monooxygenase (ABM) superfamily enzyme
MITHRRWRMVSRGAWPLLLLALALVLVAALNVLPYHVHAHHQVVLLVILVLATIISLLSAYFCLHAPERAYRRWQEDQKHTKPKSARPRTRSRADTPGTTKASTSSPTEKRKRLRSR